MTLEEFLAGLPRKGESEEPRYLSQAEKKEQRTAASKTMILHRLQAGEPLAGITPLLIGIIAESDPEWGMRCQAEMKDYSEPPQLDVFARARKLYDRYHGTDLLNRIAWQEISGMVSRTSSADMLTQRLVAAVVQCLRDEAEEQKRMAKISQATPSDTTRQMEQS